MDGRIDVNITFDDNNQIRVLPTEKFQESEQLKGECITFVNRKSPPAFNPFLSGVMNFNEMVSSLIHVMDQQAQKIEDVKLRAVGARNKVEGEEDNRIKRQQELKTQINEKKMELERLSFQLETLVKVEGEQKTIIEKLNNNES
jgi:intraflagellar transport protein 20